MRPSAKILLPERENIRPTEVADPLKFYYLPFSRGFYTRRLAVVSSMLGKGRAESLLDIGCGSGIFLKELETKCDRLFAIDIHRKMDFVKSMVEKRTSGHPWWRDPDAHPVCI